MVSVIYTLVSSMVWLVFTAVLIPSVETITQEQKRQQEETILQVTQVLAALPTATPTPPPKTSNRLRAPELSKPVPSPGPTQPAEKANYTVEPIGDGIYKMENVPIEPMSTVDDLNQAVNEFRKAHAQGVLDRDDHLCQFADQRAHEIKDTFSHAKFSAHIDEGIADGWGFHHFGENIWQGKFSGVHIVEYGWAKSPGHYGALVGQWTKGCAGVFEDNAVFIFAR